MRSVSVAFASALAASFSGAVFAQQSCECTTVIGSCEASATMREGFIEVTSDSAECSRVDYLVNGIPLVAMVTGGEERQEWGTGLEASSIEVRSCQVCESAAAAAEPSFGGSGLYTDGEVTSLIEVTPVYPPQALAAGIEGFVEIRLEVDLSGMVSSPQIVAAEPEDIFDQAALDAVRRWRYTRPRGNPQTITERIEFTLEGGVLSLRPAPTEASAPAAAAPVRNSCIQEQSSFDFGAVIDVSLVNTCDVPLLVYSCSSGTGAQRNRWVCSNPEQTRTAVASQPNPSGPSIFAANGAETFAANGRLELTRAPNSEYWLLACGVDDSSCRSEGRDWVRALDRQAQTIDPQARTRARLARSY